MILTGQPFRPLGAPPLRGAAAHAARDLNLHQTAAGGQSAETLALALKVLGTFDFSGELH
jgi:FKBP12-rapamycin complex-associated protein